MDDVRDLADTGVRATVVDGADMSVSRPLVAATVAPLSSVVVLRTVATGDSGGTVATTNGAGADVDAGTRPVSAD